MPGRHLGGCRPVGRGARGPDPGLGAPPRDDRRADPGRMGPGEARRRPFGDPSARLPEGPALGGDGAPEREGGAHRGLERPGRRARRPRDRRHHRHRGEPRPRDGARPGGGRGASRPPRSSTSPTRSSVRTTSPRRSSATTGSGSSSHGTTGRTSPPCGRRSRRPRRTSRRRAPSSRNAAGLRSRSSTSGAPPCRPRRLRRPL